MNLPKADAVPLAIVAVAALVGVVLTMTGSFAAAVVEPEYEFESAAEEQLYALMTEEFGGFLEPRMSGDWALDALAEGRALYEVQCLHCHGNDGHADTATARLLTPPPRDFGKGVVKFTSTPVGLPATRADLLRTIVESVPTTSMSSFAHLPAEQLDALADYAMYLLVRGAVWTDARDRLLAARLDDAAAVDVSAAFDAALAAQRRQFALAQASSTVPEIPAVADSTRGRELYMSEQLGCLICHREDGSGGRLAAIEGKESRQFDLSDIWGNASIARDLRHGPLRGGDSPANVYLRIRNGIKGTPMPAMADDIDAALIWDLVAYVRSVQEEE
jgi:mono/diheme cytochrome c family protein